MFPSLCQIDPEVLARNENSSPLLEVQLELVAPEIVWKPELGEAADGKVGLFAEHRAPFLET
jgi:hypothetical protein